MGRTKDVFAQLTKDVPIEREMRPLTFALLMKFSNAIRYGSTTPADPFTLRYGDMVQFMRNVQELYPYVTNSLNAQDQIDLNRYRGGIQTITNSNPTSSIMVIRYPDTLTPVTNRKIPARSCSLDLTCGDPRLLPLHIAANGKVCSDADYLMDYRDKPTSEYAFYFNPLRTNPLHCVFTHPRQLPAEDYNAVPDDYKGQLRMEYVEPFWTRQLRLSPKIANYRIEI